ncbi:hypothetical protein [Pseudalkalibacillus hwajinpoensis]|uniref:hypothetical protein n=1 Tax=Guptibacillus hwajinpoensis TaxID=208199 RepID=UPI001CD2E643|nr:hypothetical protein [Pseudalkalibacillus hwajinpoensis]MCA0990298.1 hypothetical protein [Pseudalkalibacillus hwajinpoensis]
MKWKPFFYAVLAGILAVFVVFLLNGFAFEWAPSIGIFLGIALNQYYGQRILNKKRYRLCPLVRGGHDSYDTHSWFSV